LEDDRQVRRRGGLLGMAKVWDARLHDARHTAATMFVYRRHPCRADGPPPALHPRRGAARRYQYAAQDRDRVIADALSKLVTGDVTPITASKRTRKVG